MTEANEQEARDNEILRVRVGSFLYGTQTAESDVDFYSVWVPTPDLMLGLEPVEQVNELGTDPVGRKSEVTRYPLHLFIRHALKNNPNILEVFYADPDNMISVAPMGKRLLDSVGMFVGADLAYAKFRGYAQSQRKKLTYKRERMAGFADALRKVVEWESMGRTSLPETVTIGSELNGKGYWRSYTKGMDLRQVLESLEAALEEYGWRKDLILKHGYDVKFAANLIRLLGEAFDLFHYGELRFPLSTKDNLRDIRSGKWTMEEVLDASIEWERRVDEAYAKTKLQKQSDIPGVERMMIELFKERWGFPAVVA